MARVIVVLVLLTVAGVFAGVTMADVNVPGDEARRATYDPRDASEMDDLAPAGDSDSFAAGIGTDWMLFADDREHSIRKPGGLPKRWLQNLPIHTKAFTGAARPGEFYVFQVAIYGAKAPVGPVEVGFRNIPNARCLSTGGIDFLGCPFSRPVVAAKGKIQALWVGIDIPRAGCSRVDGQVVVKDTATGVSQAIEVRIAVAGAVLDEHGDRDSWRLSRLRWLDSTIGLNDDVVTAPFVPIVRRSSTLAVLGRELVLGDDGLPGQVRSLFNSSNTAIGRLPARELLSRPFRFVVETEDGPMVFAPGSVTFARELKGAVSWHAESQVKGGDIKLTVEGVLEYDGFVECRCRIASGRPVNVRDIRLEVDVSAGANTYFMGLGMAGGKCPESVDWKWSAKVNQDGFWIGAANGGFKLELYGANRRTPLINAYYHFREIMVPESWGGADGKSGGIRLSRAANGGTRAIAYSGAHELGPTRPLDFNFKLFMTPFKPLNTDQQWSMRYLHKGQGVDDEDLRDLKRVKAMGANVLNIHHNKEPTPTINYPYFDLSMPSLKKCVSDAHANGVKVKIYYTTREITCNLPELYAFWSMGGEIVCRSPGMDGKAAKPVTNPSGPHPWLIDHLGDTGFIPAWREVIGGRYSNLLDLAVITTPDSRLDNFYCEGLAFTLRETGIDGMYIDDTTLGRKAFQRAHRIFEAAGKPLLVDMHSWSHLQPLAGDTSSAYCFMQNFPYYHRLWFGEAFDYNTPPDYWLVEISGIPFGLMGEMLNEGGNPWRGMVFGMTTRLGWSGDPRPLWKFFDEQRMEGTEMIGYWDQSCPVKTGRDDVVATVCHRAGKAIVALASWAAAPVDVRLEVNWRALGFPDAGVVFRGPRIEGFQEETLVAPGDKIHVQPGRGWLLVARR